MFVFYYPRFNIWPLLVPFNFMHQTGPTSYTCSKTAPRFSAFRFRFASS